MSAVTLIHIEDWDKFSSTASTLVSKAIPFFDRHMWPKQDIFPHDDVVWGIAYTIDPTYATETKAYLGN